MFARDFLLAFIGSFGPALCFNIEKKNALWAGLCGAIGWLAYSGMKNLTGNSLFAVFFASVTISISSEIMARAFKTPSTVFYIPSIFPLVPGIAAYNTVLFITQGKMTEALYKAVETAATAGAIAFGIVLVTTFFLVAERKRQNAM